MRHGAFSSELLCNLTLVNTVSNATVTLHSSEYSVNNCEILFEILPQATAFRAAVKFEGAKIIQQQYKTTATL